MHHTEIQLEHNVDMPVDFCQTTQKRIANTRRTTTGEHTMSDTTVPTETALVVTEPDIEPNPKAKRRLSITAKREKFVDKAHNVAFNIQDISIELLTAPCTEGEYKGSPMLKAVLANCLSVGATAKNPKDLAQISKLVALVVELSGGTKAIENLGAEDKDNKNPVLKIVITQPDNIKMMEPRSPTPPRPQFAEGEVIQQNGPIPSWEFHE